MDDLSENPGPTAPVSTDTDSTAKEPSWKPSKPLALTALALGLAVLSDVLFHWHIPGISIPIFAAAGAAALLTVGRLESQPLKTPDIILAVLAVLFAGLSSLRLEPMTRSLSILAVLALLAIWIWNYSSGSLFRSGILDFSLAWLAPAVYWIYPWSVLGQSWKKLGGARESRSVVRSVLVGLLLALPILALFSALLSAADLVFQARLQQLAEWLRLEALRDIFNHLTWIIAAFILFLGAVVMAVQKGRERSLVNNGKPIIPPFLGSIETLVILGSVSALFAVFVGIQFTYLFGGEGNISTAGYTYAEYARKGFFELVAVSFLALLLIQALRLYGKQEGEKSSLLFNIVCTILVVLVLIILGSALKRMLLYEDAYGLTRLRTYTLVGLGWIAALLAAFTALLWKNLSLRFAQLLAAAALGFTATLGILNVDAFIAQRNLRRHLEGEKLDIWYMMTLTDDAVPAVVDHAVQHPETIDDTLLADLVCRRENLERDDLNEWQAFHVSQAAARTYILTIEEQLSGYVLSVDEWGEWVVQWDYEELYCGIWNDPDRNIPDQY